MNLWPLPVPCARTIDDLRGALLLNVEGIPLSELVQRQNSLRGIENVYGTLALLTRSLATVERTTESDSGTEPTP